MSIKISKRKAIMICVCGALLISEYLSGYIGILMYTDEAIAVLFFGYLLINILKRKHFARTTYVSIATVMLMLGIGIISNILSKIQTNITAIVLDIVSNFKLLIVFFGVYEYVGKEDAKGILNAFVPLAKIFLVSGMCFGILSLFVDLGMGDAERFGIPSFRFIYSAPHVYSMTVLIAVMIVTQANSKGIYLVMAIIQMVLTTKGVSIIWAAVVLIIIYYMRHNEKIHISLLVIIGLLGIAIGQYQISSYLLNTNAPRYVLIKYGIINANNYFPIGSGFATYGSHMAAVYYSPLYERYGMFRIYGFARGFTTGVATDNYWPMLMGQGGYISAVLMLYVFWKIFLLIQECPAEKFEKAIILSVFTYFIVHTIGAATPTMASAVTMFLMIALILKKYARV